MRMRLAGVALGLISGIAAGASTSALAQEERSRPEFEPASSLLGCATGTEIQGLAYPDGQAEPGIGAKLTDFLKALKLSEEKEHRFDFNTMGCPFDLRLVLRRPYLPNDVGEVDRPDPNRREFIEWLRDVEFNAQTKLRSLLIGSSMTISVPCTILELT